MTYFDKEQVVFYTEKMLYYKGLMTQVYFQ